MKQETNDKFAAILAAAQAKAAAKAKPFTPATPAQPAAPKAATPAPQPAPKPAQPQVRTFDNLQDIEKAMKSGEMISISNLSDLVNKKPAPAPAPAPQQKPELSNFTLDEILNGTTTQEVKPPAPATPKQQQPTPATGEIKLLEYSEKSFAVIGEGTRAIKDTLMDKGGSFNRFLKCGPGYIFSKKKYYTVKTYLESLQVKA